MVRRILLNILILTGVLYLPWFITTILVVIGLFIFNNFYESIIAGVMIDLLYGVPVAGFFNVWFIYSIIFVSLYILVEYNIKNNLRFYETG